jgi:hypothetical protein
MEIIVFFRHQSDFVRKHRKLSHRRRKNCGMVTFPEVEAAGGQWRDAHAIGAHAAAG